MKCVEKGCDEEAGTPWTDCWCKTHDEERRKRITENLTRIEERLAAKDADR